MNARDTAFAYAASPHHVHGRIAAVDWRQVGTDLDAQGAAVIDRLLTPAECRDLASLYPATKLFAAASSWRGTGMGAASIATSVIRFRR